MGKIKKTILRKQDRPITESKYPSFRRFKRSDRNSVEQSMSGRNNRFTPSRGINLRSLRRSKTKAPDHRGEFSQNIPASVVFRFKKKHAPRVGVIHEHYTDERKDITSTKRIEVMTCRADDSARIRQFEQWENEGKGKIKFSRRRTVWHRLDKQDANFKPTKSKR